MKRQLRLPFSLLHHSRSLPPTSVHRPNPALVSEREATPLPRIALFLLCAAYVLPGLFRRDPWKSADITAFGYILNIARDRTSWLAPTVGGLPADGAVLPYWIGAVFVKLTDGWLEPALAARIPFALLLTAALALTWYAAYHLARSESAQPLPFAFGGEAAPVDYARAIADGAVLALIACLGLLQLGHETTPELAQLAAVTLFLYGMSSSVHRPLAGGVYAALSLLALAASGAPSIAMLLAAVGIAVALRSPQAGNGRLAAFIGAGAVLGAAAATGLGAWGNRLGDFSSAGQALGLLREFAWFAWPAWFLALWTLWRWRRHLLSRHIAVPLGCTGVLVAVWLAMAGEDRALMLALPGLAVLAAFALPTLQRSASAAIDWFSIFFFTIAATAGWLFYAAMQTGSPAKLAANVAKLSPGYANTFSLASLVFALAGTLAWLWLARWRTGRNRHPLWKSLVLPASGVTLCWLLAMTLLLPPVDNARSYRSMIQRIARLVPPTGCIAAPDMPRAQVVALEYLGGYRVDAVTPLAQTRCEHLLMARTQVKPGPGWRYLGREIRLRKDDDVTDIYRRVRAR
jgi:4-amino-4-deoxy-L-arabinose transferase-like glycosyltransferase